MVTIAIIGVLSAVAVPNLIAWRANQQLNGSARQVLSAINGAKMAAVKNNTAVTITFDAAGKQVTTAFTNRLTGVESTTTMHLNPLVEIDSTTFASNAFNFNSRGLPVAVDNPAAFAAGSVSLKNAKGDSFTIRMASTGVTRIDKP